MVDIVRVPAAIAARLPPKAATLTRPISRCRAASAGSLTAPPMLSLTIQKIKIPIAIEMGRKQLADSSGEVVAGPWDAAKLTTGTDGTQLHYFKGSTSVLVWATQNDGDVRSTLIEIAKRVAATQ